MLGGGHEGVGEIGGGRGGGSHMMGTSGALNKGQIHTKRHSGEDPPKPNSASVVANDTSLVPCSTFLCSVPSFFLFFFRFCFLFLSGI